MPAGPRIRSNSEFGLTTDAPLTAGATTFNSARLSLFPVVSAAHAVVTLDPRAINGEPEIVIITAHTAAATVATITRGAYGTVARSHPVSTEWIHAPLDEDFIEILTSVTRPSDPYEGQFIFETDTNKLVGYGGVDWAPRDAGGILGVTNVSVSDVTIPGGLGAQDLDGYAVTVTVGTGRRIRVSAFLCTGSTTGVGGTQQAGIREGVTAFARSFFDNVAGNQIVTHSISCILAPTPGVHTYKVYAECAPANSRTYATAAALDYILVEDIGAA